MLSPLSYGLYHKVIIQSGSAAATFGANEKKTAKELARRANLLKIYFDV